MIHNLLSNALKYTKRGKVLIGCRRQQERLRVEIWDTGIGIPEFELRAIFEEYHQLDNPARQRSHGLGGSPSLRAWADCSAIRFMCARCMEKARYSRLRSPWPRIASLRRQTTLYPM